MQYEFSTDVTGTIERPAVLLTFTTHLTARPDVGRSDRAKSLVRSSATAAELATKFATLPAVVAYRSQAASIGEVRDRATRGIEQDSDAILLLWKRTGQSDDDAVWRIGVQVAKQRNGPTGEITLAYRRACMRFENYAPEM